MIPWRQLKDVYFITTEKSLDKFYLVEFQINKQYTIFIYTMFGTCYNMQEYAYSI